jgi:SagB-type dehydrogenase family enzyme
MIGDDFMKEGTRFLYASNGKESVPSDARMKMPQPPLEDPYEGELIALPKIEELKIPKRDLEEVLLKRRSVRRYSEEPFTIDELAYACYMTQGIKEMKERNTFRVVPSAGARHAFETLLLVNNVIGLKKGLYRYIASKHKLLLLSENEKTHDQVLEASYGQKMVVESGMTFIWYANTYRMTYRYQMRGYRYLFLDAGHVMQNLYLIADQLHAGTCAIAAYDDDLMNKALGLDGEEKFVIYLGPLGKLKE